MHLDLGIALAGLIVGFVIGLTGVGGGALLTPVLVLFFGITPAAAVSSDIVASLILKPVGGSVHWKRGTVNMKLVLWLGLGAVPGALGGAYVVNRVIGSNVDSFIKTTLGWVLLIAAAAMLLKAAIQNRRKIDPAEPGTLPIHALATALIGLFGGFVVGVTSVGSGSLMIVLLMVLYPRISMRELVGTDLIQAIPLVGAATLGYAFWGTLHVAVIGSLLLGAIPSVWLGAHFSSKAKDSVIRPVLVLAMSVSALKLLGLSNTVMGEVIVAGVVVMAAAWLVNRRRNRRELDATTPARMAGAAAN